MGHDGALLSTPAAVPICQFSVPFRMSVLLQRHMMKAQGWHHQTIAVVEKVGALIPLLATRLFVNPVQQQVLTLADSPDSFQRTCKNCESSFELSSGGMLSDPGSSTLCLIAFLGPGGPSNRVANLHQETSASFAEQQQCRQAPSVGRA